ncbi:class I SAM-dependent methyltransferase [Streptomyces tsukubensis]|uniref:class I SAM-dependent methyltransferase n=1 Tax=Streptomyces tsukubensis TaxID=83656 RepID=UPI00344E01BC
MPETTKPGGAPPPPRTRPPLPEGWRPTLLSLRLAKKHPKLSRAVIRWEMRRAPKATGPGDLSDLLAPGQRRPADFPAYYIANPVHHMKGLHWMHPSMGYRLERMAEDFPLGKREQIRWWVESQVLDRGVRPRRILEVGAGTGATAFVYAQVFPEAEVVGVDLSPSVLRWARRRADELGIRNVSFYHMDAGDLSAFDDGSFDVVHESHLLHEMPAYQIRRTVAEMVRVCAPGGFLGFFDWAIPENERDWRQREGMVRNNVEPFMLEYSRTDHPKLLAELGCEDVVMVERHSQSASWRARRKVA